MQFRSRALRHHIEVSGIRLPRLAFAAPRFVLLCQDIAGKDRGRAKLEMVESSGSSPYLQTHLHVDSLLES